MRETESSTLRAKDEVFCNIQIYNNQQIELRSRYCGTCQVHFHVHNMVALMKTRFLVLGLFSIKEYLAEFYCLIPTDCQLNPCFTLIYMLTNVTETSHIDHSQKAKSLPMLQLSLQLSEHSCLSKDIHTIYAELLTPGGLLYVPSLSVVINLSFSASVGLPFI